MLTPYVVEHLTELLAVFNVISFLAGLFIGHWLALGRDRRKEFNDIASGLIAGMTREAASPRIGGGIGEFSAYCLSARMSTYTRSRFAGACERYWAAQKECVQDEIGQPTYANPDKVAETAKHVLSFLKLK